MAANPFSKNIKLCIKFLREEKIIKYQNQIAQAIGFDSSTISRAANDEKVGEIVNTSEKVLNAIKKKFGLEIINGEVVRSQVIPINSDPNTLQTILDKVNNFPNLYVGEYVMYYIFQTVDNICSDSKIQIIEDGVAVQKTTFDVEPVLKEAAELRDHQEGKRWGDGRVVGKLPQSVLAHIMNNIPNRVDRDVYVMNWLRQNPAFITYKPHFETKSASFLT